MPDGAQVLIEVRSQDILVASQSPGPVSAQNVFQVTITDITQREEGCLVHLQASEDAPTLVATVGHQSVERLGLTRGHPAWAVIKASAIRVVEA